ncbi:LacI family DNA-binding transcriptional regulator [Ruficoccus amylovorans]|uniref:LacI family DNA-binding transcriptional regulator n=1 Tax=Ruficoccus amylovorans TaxID=1804625 RepID=A0A842HIY5_9BACT|nr:LacI family DNA-binding transcriptional regulator [Ruficoccus amylovorans]MBC2596382.1 LacI family DNA-binding transcriptional regulator [Ruficoccus amylovorans]
MSGPADRTPSLQDIADKLGVTKATVSMALRNHPRISLKTREAVKQTAAELGYRINPLVAACMTQMRTRREPGGETTLAFLHDHRQEDIVRGSLPASYAFRGAVERGQPLGYRVEPFAINSPGMTHRRLSDILTHRGIRGVIVSLLQESKVVDLAWDHFAGVSIGYTLHPAVLDRICHDHFTACLSTLERLTRLGYGRIGLALRGIDHRRSVHFWAAAYLSFFRENHKRPLPILIVEGEDRAALARWLREARPDVVLSGNSFIPGWAREDQLADAETDFVNLSWEPGHAELAGVSHTFSEMGAGAVESVTAALQLNQTGLPLKPKTTLIPGEWIDGPSLRHACD